MSLLEIRGLKVKVGPRRILDGLDLEVDTRESVALLGPNGIGKSTLARALMGDPKLNVTGEIRFEGEDVLKMTPDARARAGIFVAQQNPVEIPGLRGVEMIREALVARGVRDEDVERPGREARSDYLSLDTTREKLKGVVKGLKTSIWFLEREINVGMSGGEKKKSEVLQMLALEPKLAVLDEVDSGLDVDATEMVAEKLLKFQEETGVAYLIISHDAKFLERMRVARTGVLWDGKVVKQGGIELALQIASEGYGGILGGVK